MCAHLLVLRPCLEVHLGNGYNRRQRLATKTHGAECEKIVGLPDLRGGMALEGQSCVRLGHALSVVDDLDRGAPCVHYQHVDVLGSRIYRILHQFLDDGSRSLYHLSRSYLVGYAVGKQLNDVAHICCLLYYCCLHSVFIYSLYARHIFSRHPFILSPRAQQEQDCCGSYCRDRTP